MSKVPKSQSKAEPTVSEVAKEEQINAEDLTEDVDVEDDGDAEDDEEDDEEDDGEDDDAEGDRLAIDLSENEVYRGICTLFEDEEGNNILEYISLLHTELIGINKSLENLRGIRKELSRLADSAELITKSTLSSGGDQVRKEKKSEKTK